MKKFDGNKTSNDEGLNSAEQNIVDLMQKNSNLSVKEIASKLGMTLKTAEYKTGGLKKQGIIICEGSKKKGKWVTVSILFSNVQIVKKK
ncbi:MAG: winged helix-turn-helix transcriptional regulator [Endomicrobium sp.]|nr:winged helix-turn-helix transcriptional regulator [Endomicrobium sp.]